MDVNPPPTVASQSHGNWWTRNWKWFVPTGCLTVLVLLAAFVLLIVTVVFGAIKSSDVAKDAIARAKGTADVISALGSPVKDGLFVSGNIEVTGPSGKADLAVPISGPKGKGTIYIVATKSAGAWNYSTLHVQVKNTGQKISLGPTRPPPDAD